MKDPVTGLHGRQKFLQILESDVNETAAHDSALQAVAKVLEQVRREGDQIARIGDDQFALILQGVMNSGHAELAAHKIHRLMDVPVHLERDTIRCPVNIGIALYPEHAHGADALLAAADEAQRRARSTGQSCCVAKGLDPNEFIPIAESTGFIRPLTEWMLNSANIVELIVDLAHRFKLSVVAEDYHHWLANYRGINASGAITASDEGASVSV